MRVESFQIQCDAHTISGRRTPEAEKLELAAHRHGDFLTGFASVVSINGLVFVCSGSLRVLTNRQAYICTTQKSWNKAQPLAFASVTLCREESNERTTVFIHRAGAASGTVSRRARGPLRNRRGGARDRRCLRLRGRLCGTWAADGAAHRQSLRRLW